MVGRVVVFALICSSAFAAPGEVNWRQKYLDEHARCMEAEEKLSSATLTIQTYKKQDELRERMRQGMIIGSNQLWIGGEHEWVTSSTLQDFVVR